MAMSDPRDTWGSDEARLPVLACFVHCFVFFSRILDYIQNDLMDYKINYHN